MSDHPDPLGGKRRMDIESVLSALDRYIDAKGDLAKALEQAYHSDWDCGFSRELDQSLSTTYKRQEVASARAAFAQALEAYIMQKTGDRSQKTE